MNKEKYYNGTRYFKCKSCGMVFKESFTIDKSVFLMELNQVKTPSVSIHKRCLGGFYSKGKQYERIGGSGSNTKQYYGIGELIGISVEDFEENKNGE